VLKAGLHGLTAQAEQPVIGKAGAIQIVGYTRPSGVSACSDHGEFVHGAAAGGSSVLRP
jgi:hypothetical protein